MFPALAAKSAIFLYLLALEQGIPSSACARDFPEAVEIGVFLELDAQDAEMNAILDQWTARERTRLLSETPAQLAEALCQEFTYWNFVGSPSRDTLKAELKLKIQFVKNQGFFYWAICTPGEIESPMKEFVLKQTASIPFEIFSRKLQDAARLFIRKKCKAGQNKEGELVQRNFFSQHLKKVPITSRGDWRRSQQLLHLGSWHDFLGKSIFRVELRPRNGEGKIYSHSQGRNRWVPAGGDLQNLLADIKNYAESPLGPVYEKKPDLQPWKTHTPHYVFLYEEVEKSNFDD